MRKSVLAVLGSWLEEAGCRRAETGPLGHVTSFYFDRCLVTMADRCTNTSCLLATTKFVHCKSIRRSQPMSFDQTYFPNLSGRQSCSQSKTIRFCCTSEIPEAPRIIFLEQIEFPGFAFCWRFQVLFTSLCRNLIWKGGSKSEIA